MTVDLDRKLFGRTVWRPHADGHDYEASLARPRSQVAQPLVALTPMSLSDLPFEMPDLRGKVAIVTGGENTNHQSARPRPLQPWVWSGKGPGCLQCCALLPDRAGTVRC